MAHHTLFISDLAPETGDLALTGDEAHHACRVKRVRPGELVTLLNGAGLRMSAEVVEAKRELRVNVIEFDQAEPVRPEVRIWSPAPKGPRSGDMIDALSQVGAASWTPMQCEFAGESVNRKKLERLERVAIESAKQCGRAWLLRLEGSSRPPRFEDALRSADPAERIVLADASGAPMKSHGTNGTDRTNATKKSHESHQSHVSHASHEPHTRPVRLLIGPEGGWSAKELETARSAGVEIASFGPHAMRIELAAPVAAAIVMHGAYH
ncbi:MAG: 16S rRNA (uracil(1498)-N(3))-methyltransferase [Phycisphaeraceae bacterium]|nr:MAG: 16S rRNA (uracil(1498)-N(3))-methyltransferase [Phycisphaeraceae bacterium]